MSPLVFSAGHLRCFPGSCKCHLSVLLLDTQVFDSLSYLEGVELPECGDGADGIMGWVE